MAFPEGDNPKIGVVIETGATKVIRGDGKSTVAVSYRGVATDLETAQDIHEIIEEDALQAGVEPDVDIVAMDGSGSSSENRDRSEGTSFGFSGCTRWPKGMNANGNWGEPPKEPRLN